MAKNTLLPPYFPEIVIPSKQHQGSTVTPFSHRSFEMAGMFFNTSTMLKETMVSLRASVTLPFSIGALNAECFGPHVGVSTHRVPFAKGRLKRFQHYAPQLTLANVYG